MSFGGHGGRTRVGTKVKVNVYDLSPANDCLYTVGLGLHHSGVEILGTEWSFASGGGIFESTPKFAPGARFREQIEIGGFEGGQSELNKAISELRNDYGPNDYNLIRKNCNHFANALCWKLLRKTLPGHVNRLADIGMCCSCLLPKKLLENAPVGDPNAPAMGNTTSSGFMVRPGIRAITAQSTTTQPVFTGTGAKLGSASETERQGLLSSWSSKKEESQDDLTDRREKARKAALARLEQRTEQTR